MVVECLHSAFTGPQRRINHYPHQSLSLGVLYNHKRTDHIEMKKLREKVNLMSVNLLCVYHVALEMFNILMDSSAEK